MLLQKTQGFCPKNSRKLLKNSMVRWFLTQAFFFNKIAKTQGKKNSRPQKLKGNFAQKLKVPELFQICKNSRQKKLKTAKTQGKFCPKTQGTGAFPNLCLKETPKKVVKNRKLALIWHFHFKFFILNLKTTLKIENLDI